jgi:dipeptidyl-peptidase-3
MFIFGIFRTFGHEGEMADNIIYVNWLNMVRAGLLGLEFYTPENSKWRQVATYLLFIVFLCICLLIYFNYCVL